MHRSVVAKETNSNYGWWNGIIETHRPEPEKGQLQMKIGLNGYFDSKYLQLSQMPIIPFVSGGKE